MIKKLHRKFVFINSLLISGILIIMLVNFCLGVFFRQRQSNTQLLEQILAYGYDPSNLKGISEREKLKYVVRPNFYAEAERDGRILSVDMRYFPDLEEADLQTAVESAAAGGKDSDMIKSTNLRYMRRWEDDHWRIAFVDVSAQWFQLKSYLGSAVQSLVTGVLAAAALAHFLSALAIRPVQRSWDQQKQFVADASHEIKTPLTIILANADILLANERQTIAAQRKWVEYIKLEAERMAELLEGMMFLAKADVEQQGPISSELDLSDVIWSAALPFESVAYEKGVELDMDISPDIRIFGIESGLTGLTSILLDNACKYAPPGGSIKLCLHRKQEKVLLSVNNDCRQAIDKEQLEHIFDRFYRIDESRDREHGGYGLGLAIAKAIAEQHGALIKAEYAKERGMTISVEFSKRQKGRR